jgi:hypothetical protein
MAGLAIGRTCGSRLLSSCAASAASRMGRLSSRRSSPLCFTPSSSARDYSVVLFGTDDVSLPTLERLHDMHLKGVQGTDGRPIVEKLEVVCPSDRPAGRGRALVTMPVMAYARKHGIKTYDVPAGL